VVGRGISGLGARGGPRRRAKRARAGGSQRSSGRRQRRLEFAVAPIHVRGDDGLGLLGMCAFVAAPRPCACTQEQERRMEVAKYERSHREECSRSSTAYRERISATANAYKSRRANDFRNFVRARHANCGCQSCGFSTRTQNRGLRAGALSTEITATLAPEEHDGSATPSRR